MAWDPKDHPRWPGDTPGGRGGEFRDAEYGAWVGRIAGQLGFPTGLQAAISSGIREEEQHFEGNSGAKITRPHFNNGDIGIRKNIGRGTIGERPVDEETDAEVLGAATARALGVPAPEVIRTAPNEVMMTLIPSRPSGWAQYKRGQGLTVSDLQGREQPAREHTTAEWRLGLFDLLVENHDRTNPTNLRQGTDGLAYTIDHGKAFMYDPDRAGLPGWSGAPGPYAGPFVTGFENPKWATNPLTKADIVWARARLQNLRSQFEAAGRLDWWETMSQRLEAIGRRAKGTQDLLAG